MIFSINVYAGLQVNPIYFEFGKKKTKTITVTNTDQKKQLDLVINGVDESYKKIHDVLVYPPMVTIPPGQKAKIKVRQRVKVDEKRYIYIRTKPNDPRAMGFLVNIRR